MKTLAVAVLLLSSTACGGKKSPPPAAPSNNTTPASDTTPASAPLPPGFTESQEGGDCSDDHAVMKRCAAGLTCVMPTNAPISEHTPGKCQKTS